MEKGHQPVNKSIVLSMPVEQNKKRTIKKKIQSLRNVRHIFLLEFRIEEQKLL